MARPLSPSLPTVADAVIDVICTVSARNKAQYYRDEARGDELSEEELMITDFECVTRPDTSLRDFCKNYVGNMRRPELWLLVLITLDKLCRLTNQKINEYNAHRLVLTAFTLMFKLYCDYSGVTACVARLCGMGCKELAEMEASFLHLIDWRLVVPRSVYYAIIQQLPRVKEAARSSTSGDVHLIPDGLLPGELMRQHCYQTQDAVQPLPQQGGSSPTASAPRWSVSCPPPDRVQTAATEGVLSAYTYETSPLELLPPIRLLDLLPVDASPSVDLQQIKPRRVSIALADAGLQEMLHPTPARTPSLAVSRGSSNRSHSSTLATTSTSSQCPSAAAAKPGVARVPCPPQQPRSGARSAVTFSSGCSRCAPASPPSCSPSDAAEGDAQGPRPAGQHSAARGASGKRGRIEAARNFCQCCPPAD